MVSSCSIFGLGLQVNVPLAGLRGLPPARRLDVAMTLGPLPRHLRGRSEACEVYASESLDESGRPAVRVARLESHYVFEYADGTEIAVDSRGTRVWASAPPAATVEDTATYLLGPTLGFVLRLRGITCLHASAVMIGGRAAAFVGPAGAGKSSTAAAFARAGYPVLTDDVAALRETAHGFEVQPAYPRLRLWPDSSRSIFGSEEALPRITPTWDKRYLDLNTEPFRFAGEAAPLAAVYILGERIERARSRITNLEQRAALMALVAETYSTRLIDRTRRAGEFDALSRLVAAIPVRRLEAPDDFTRVSQVLRAVIEDLSTIRRPG